MMNKSDWIWMPHAGHFICGSDCRFHLSTYVGNFVVSTVGEYLPDSSVREIFAQSRGVTLTERGDARRSEYMRKLGWEQIGCDRLYETMVFPSIADPNNLCCPFKAVSGRDLDFRGYNDPSDAAAGHHELCEKWAKEPAVELTEEDLEDPKVRMRRTLKALRENEDLFPKK